MRIQPTITWTRGGCLLLLMVCLAILRPALLNAAESEGRFVPVEVLIDSGESPLAAYQVLIEITSGNARIVGLEGGQSPVFAGLPRHDTKALPGEEVIIADFSLAKAADLPKGLTRVATIHVFVTDTRPPEFVVLAQTATNAEGEVIPVKVTAKIAIQAARP